MTPSHPMKHWSMAIPSNGCKWIFHGLSISTINREQSSVKNPLLVTEISMGFPEWMIVPGVLDIITPHNTSTEMVFLNISPGQ